MGHEDSHDKEDRQDQLHAGIQAVHCAVNRIILTHRYIFQHAGPSFSEG